MLGTLLAIPVSVGLLVCILRMKRFDPFPKFTLLKLLIAGFAAVTLSGILTIIGAVINLLIQIGPEQLELMKDAESAAQVLQQIVNASRELTAQSLLLGFARTFILIGLVEELLKYLFTKIVMRKKGVVNTWMDALLCFAITAVSFQMIEDVQFSSGSILTVIFRALSPFHFTFAVIMGYFYGLGKVRGNGLYTIAAIVVPAFIHTMYDFSINLLNRSDQFFGLTLVMLILMFILTVIMILKLRKWHREGTLDIYIY